MAIHLFADVLSGFGGIETYLDALARRLAADGWPVRIEVSLNGPAPFLDAVEQLGVPVYRQPYVPGDRWQVRQRLLIRHLARRLRPGDWVYCVRQPMPEIYLALVRAVHRRGAKLAASWMFAPEFLPPPPGALGERFCKAVRETDVPISVAECTKGQFREVYGYERPVSVVRYHNVELFDAPVPLPPGPPYHIGYMGRIAIEQKNLDTILQAFKRLTARRGDVILNMHGGGPDSERLQALVEELGLTEQVVLHGRYELRRDLLDIVSRNHLFIYTSRFEGGPCFSLIELLQAGRFVVTSPVGGIPDIYGGRPEIGAMVPPDEPEAIADGLDRAIDLIEAHGADPHRIRARYVEEFHDEIAHRQWLAALGLERTSSSVAVPLADGLSR
ncbi:glycosyltransferase [Labrys monachus]|uniref:Glycosyltransferase involved in cell wall biosynthesis n=1 Tax=Labrys monachus TaxID=217067 RepID=A0ABU0FJK8_9HYPH|nr:glycosyltransferase [Labrys monachus]MDQ0394789.1 glycosyltransferase involved in cell wall biosynthesis [Labrys monachus]